MKKTNKITLSAIMSACAVIMMLLSYFPYLTYAVPAVAGLFIMAIVIEVDCKYAFLGYLTSSVLVFLLAEPESKLMYICLFGYYPVLKAVIEKIKIRALGWILKIAVFNISVIAVYGLLLTLLFDISLSEVDGFAKYGPILLLLIGNVAFVLYDFAVSKMALFYIRVVAPKINRIFKH